jgi:dTDP-glucose pyrophosphorylase
MAGEGSRFKQAGIETPKHMVSVDGRTIFNYAVSSLSDFFDETFVFVCRTDRADEEFIADECASLDIERYETVGVSTVTDGQATSALQADPVIDDNEPVIIYNIDTYVEKGNLRKSDVAGDGWIPVFRADGDQWSFVKTDDSGYAVEVAEKERISDLATLGLYYFDEWRAFKDAYNEIGEAIKHTYGEKYICPLYDWLIDEGYEIQIEEIQSDAIHVLGTPTDVTKFHQPFADKHDL